MTSISNSERSLEQPLHGPYYRYVVLVTLMAVYTLSHLDRQIIAILAVPIKTELQLSDSQLGLLGGFAFAVFYTALGIPVARLSDSYSRPRIIGVALALWSLFTALCGLAGGFATLLLARMGVGVGEAGGVVPSYSLLSDYFPPHQRGRATAVFSLGAPLGAAAGLFAGGYLAVSYGWRSTLIYIGLAGIILTPFLLTIVKEVPRGRLDPVQTDVTRPKFMDVIRALNARPAFWVMTLASGFAGMMSYGLGFWLPVFLQRSLAYTLAETSVILSICAFGGGTLSLIGAGILSDMLGRKSMANYGRIAAFGSIATLACVMVTLNAVDAYVILVSLFGIYLFFQSYGPPTLALVLNLAPANMRATASAINLLVFNIMGLGIGPWLFGAASEALTPRFGQEGLRYAILACAIVLYICSTTLFLKGGSLAKAKTDR